MTEQEMGGGSQVQPRRRVRQEGTVASISGEKSVVVRVDRRVKHSRYHKYISRRSKFMAHDESGCKIGDVVEIVSVRRMSARKRWRVSKVLRRAVVVAPRPKETKS